MIETIILLIGFVLVWIILLFIGLLFFYSAGKLNKECDKRAIDLFQAKMLEDEKNDLS